MYTFVKHGRQTPVVTFQSQLYSDIEISLKKLKRRLTSDVQHASMFLLIIEA